MAEPPSPEHAVTFDLASGLVHLADAPKRVLCAADALEALLEAAPPVAREAFAERLGAPLGTRLARRLDAASATVEEVVDHLGLELALAGLGALSVERWGAALVLVVDHAPLGADTLAAVIAAALEAATRLGAHVIPLMRDATRTRLLVTGAAGAAKARERLGEGRGWGEVLVELHGAAS